MQASVVRQVFDKDKEEKRQIARKAFLLGVDWILKTIQSHPDVWNVDTEDAKILRAKAEKVISNYVPEAQ